MPDPAEHDPYPIGDRLTGAWPQDRAPSIRRRQHELGELNAILNDTIWHP